MTSNQKFTKDDFEIMENVISSFEIIEDMLTKSHSIGYFSTRSRQLDFRDAIESIRIHLIKIQNKFKE